MDPCVQGGPSILVVDDEEVIAAVLARGLRFAGYEVEAVYDGHEALRLLTERRFDVLLSDIHMPGISGQELQRLAREQDSDLAVLLITAAYDIDTAVQCLKKGVYDYVTKPFQINDIVARVEKALEQRRVALEKQRLEQANRDYQVRLEQRVAEQADRIRSLFLHSLEALNQALEAKDTYTRDHSQRVADLATALATRLCPGEVDFAAKVRVAALFHDIGKIGVPEAILNKPDKLTEDEMAEVRRHPVLSAAILRPLLEGDAEILAMVRSHHERWDGKGYPDGLRGEETQPGACIMAVADAYDAMTSARAYRRGISPNKALQILREGAGQQWDSEVVETLLEMADSGALAVVVAGMPIDNTLPGLVVSALEMAFSQRRQQPEGALICHSDRGSKYACADYQAALANVGLSAR